jgi:hypothetical protein
MNRTARMAIALAAGRIAFGIALAAAPGRVGSSWIGTDAQRTPPQIPIRGLGARDVAVGGGIVAAALGGGDLRPWLLGCVVADLVDVGAILAAGDAVPARARAGTLAIAGSSAVAFGALTVAAKPA